LSQKVCFGFSSSFRLREESFSDNDNDNNNSLPSSFFQRENNSSVLLLHLTLDWELLLWCPNIYLINNNNNTNTTRLSECCLQFLFPIGT